MICTEFRPPVIGWPANGMFAENVFSFEVFFFLSLIWTKLRFVRWPDSKFTVGLLSGTHALTLLKVL